MSKHKLDGIISEVTHIDTMQYETNFSQELAIDKTDLEHEFLTHSDKFAYYAGLSELAQARADKVKFELEVLYAQLDINKRKMFNAAVDEDGKKFKYTEKMVENEIIADASYQKKMDQLLELQKTASLMNRAREAFNHRKEMLIQLANNSRVGDPRVKADFVKDMIRKG
jgi:hypothetical protein